MPGLHPLRPVGARQAAPHQRRALPRASDSEVAFSERPRTRDSPDTHNGQLRQHQGARHRLRPEAAQAPPGRPLAAAQARGIHPFGRLLRLLRPHSPRTRQAAGGRRTARSARGRPRAPPDRRTGRGGPGSGQRAEPDMRGGPPQPHRPLRDRDAAPRGLRALYGRLLPDPREQGVPAGVPAADRAQVRRAGHRAEPAQDPRGEAVARLHVAEEAHLLHGDGPHSREAVPRLHHARAPQAEEDGPHGRRWRHDPRAG